MQSNLTAGILDDQTTAAYLRVASVAIGIYDYICTLPAEYQFYRAQKSVSRLSTQCILFILIRYSSIAVMTISNVGFFASFTRHECSRFFIVSPIFKVFQTIISQVILAFRTYAISKKSRIILWLLAILLVVSIPLEFTANLWMRAISQHSVTSSKQHNCTSGNPTSHRVAWFHYLISMIFDLFTIGVSTIYLWRHTSNATRMSNFLRTLLYEGIGYFVILTGVNILNLILYRNPRESVQSSGASLGYVVTWIMSQSILIHQRKAADEFGDSRGRYTVRETVGISHSLNTPQSVNRALRSQFNRSTRQGKDKFVTIPSAALTALSSLSYGSIPDANSPASATPSIPNRIVTQARTREDDAASIELDVRVTVEETVRVTIDRNAYDREDYRRPRVIWDSIPLSTVG